MIFSLEIDRVATIVVGSTNGLGLPHIKLESFLFLQAKAVISAAAISFFVILTYYLRFSAAKRGGREVVDNRIAVQSDLVITIVVMAIVSALVIFSDLVKVEDANTTERLSVVLFVLLYLFIVISPLVHSEKYSDAEILIRYERMRVILASVFICYLIGLAVHFVLRRLGFDLVYGTEEFLSLGFLWYALALEPLRHRSEWPRKITSFFWVAMYFCVGFLAGALYGALLYSGHKTYMGGPYESVTLFCWGLYGLIPTIAFIFSKLVLRKSGRALWVITYLLSAISLVAVTIMLHKYANKDGGIVVGMTTAVLCILMIYIPEKYLQRSVAASRV